MKIRTASYSIASRMPKGVKGIARVVLKKAGVVPPKAGVAPPTANSTTVYNSVAVVKEPIGNLEITKEAYMKAREDVESPQFLGSRLSLQKKAAYYNERPYGYSDEYDLIKPHFDIAFYLSKYQDIFTKGLDPVAHYIKAGAREGRDPSPYFSTRRYLDRYPEVRASGLTPFGHWISEGRAKGYAVEPYAGFEELCEALGMSFAEAQTAYIHKHDDIRSRLENGELGAQVEKAAKLDPRLTMSWPTAIQMNIPPFRNGPTVKRTLSLARLQEAVGFRRKRAVILVNKPRWGFSPRAEGFLVRSLARLMGVEDLVVVYTDKTGDIREDKFPSGVDQVSFPDCIERLDDRQRLRVLVEFIRSMRPEFVFSVNSRAFWQLIERYGRALSREARLVPYFFCDEETPLGYRTGYPLRYFYRIFPYADQVATDSHYLANRFREQYMVPEHQSERIRVVSAPCDPAIGSVEVAQEGNVRPQVFWAGRFDAQKRVDIVYQIADRMPDVDFRMWGERVLGGAVSAARPSNVVHEGTYNDFNDVPLSHADAWLYTAAWDGVPNQLIELGMMGIPIAGSLVSGTGEVLCPDCTWPVSDIEDIDGYVSALRDILKDPEGARRRSRTLREYLLATRHPDAHLEQVKRIIDSTPRFGRQA